MQIILTDVNKTQLHTLNCQYHITSIPYTDHQIYLSISIRYSVKSYYLIIKTELYKPSGFVMI
jgi:hypothetical protein